MPGKTAKSAPLPPFGLSGMTALVRAATLSCENAGKSQKCTQDRESSGESRFRCQLRPPPRSPIRTGVSQSPTNGPRSDIAEGALLNSRRLA
jgi:hypothetical protein